MYVAVCQHSQCVLGKLYHYKRKTGGFLFQFICQCNNEVCMYSLRQLALWISKDMFTVLKTIWCSQCLWSGWVVFLTTHSSLLGEIAWEHINTVFFTAKIAIGVEGDPVWETTPDLWMCVCWTFFTVQWLSLALLQSVCLATGLLQWNKTSQ